MIESLSPTPVEWLLLACCAALFVMDVAQMVLLGHVSSQVTKFGGRLEKDRLNHLEAEVGEDPPGTPLS